MSDNVNSEGNNAANTTQQCASKDTPAPQHKKVRPLHVFFLVLAVIATLCLAYWQWVRFRSGSGSFQNLGYALQWPFFGGFIVYAYKTYLRYENEIVDNADDTTYSPIAHRAEEKTTIREIDEDFLPERPHITVETFNALNTPRRRHGNESE